ncbi:hypothetical protein HELA111659_01415 [Helicobacter labetoulli]
MKSKFVLWGGCPSKLKNRIQSLCAFLQINNFFVCANFLNIDTNFLGVGYANL